MDDYDKIRAIADCANAELRAQGFGDYRVVVFHKDLKLFTALTRRNENE